jgi:hypothetical protein
MSGPPRLADLPADVRAIVTAALAAQKAAAERMNRAGVNVAPSPAVLSPRRGRAGHHPGPALARSDPKAAA